MDYNSETFNSCDSDNRSEDNNSTTQSHPVTFFGTQTNQMRGENSNAFSLPQGITRLSNGEDGEYQLLAFNASAPGYASRGRTSSRGNISTASSLSPKNRVPQNPDTMLDKFASTKSTMSGAQMIDDSSEDEGNFNEFPEKSTKSPKNKADEQGEQAEERENNLEIVE